MVIVDITRPSLEVCEHYTRSNPDVPVRSTRSNLDVLYIKRSKPEVLVLDDERSKPEVVLLFARLNTGQAVDGVRLDLTRLCMAVRPSEQPIECVQR